MSKSHLLLKSRAKTEFVKWMNNSCAGTMGTRHVRLTWVAERTTKPIIVAQLKCFNQSVREDLESRLKGLPLETLPDTNLNNRKENPTSRLIYPRIEGESSRLWLEDLLTTLWNSIREKSSVDLNKIHTDANNKNSCSFNFLRNEGMKKENIIVEFGSPNIAKPLHMGHLRSTVTGHYVAGICKAAGNNVTNICFLGDWGTQFGILQAGLAHWLPGEDVIQSANKLDLKSLLNYYVRAVKEKDSNEEFSKKAYECSVALEKGDSTSINTWSSIREKTVNHLSEFWDQFGIHYDVIQGESEFTVQSEHTTNALQSLKDLNCIEVGSDGCIYAILPSTDKIREPTKIPLVKADGSSLYLVRDVACAISRLKQLNFDRMLYVVDKTQANHFITLFRLLENVGVQQLGAENESRDNKLRHVSFGRVEGMSTRAGNFVLLSDVISDGTLLMEESRVKSPNTRLMNDSSISLKLAISALIVNSLKVKRNRDTNFDWHEALKPRGETGTRLQYTHARLRSLEIKFSTVFLSKNAGECIDFNGDYILNDPVALNLALHLANFEDAFWSSYSELEPCILLGYLFKLCDKTSKGLKELNVQSEPDRSVAATRFMLFSLSRKILAVGLEVLGIQPLDQI